MKSRHRIAVVGLDEAVASGLGAAHVDAVDVTRFASVPAVLATETAPQVVVLDSDAAGEPAAAVRAITQRWPEVRVIVTGDSPSALSRAVVSGARGFLLRPYTPSELAGIVRQSLELSDDTSGHRSRGRILAVYGPKGGSGCSTIAVGIAVLTAARAHTTVALVDLDLQFGDVDVMLDLRSANSIADLVAHEPLDQAIIDDTLVRHESGVRVLPAPSDLTTAATIRPDAVERTLDALRERFDLVVCDLWSSLDDLTTRVLRMADHVVLVTKPDVAALRSMSRALAAREMAEIDKRALIVVNRLPGRGGLSAADVERGLGRHISVAIPSDGAVVIDALNRGLSIVDPRVRSRTRRSLEELARAVWDALGLEASAPAASIAVPA